LQVPVGALKERGHRVRPVSPNFLLKGRFLSLYDDAANRFRPLGHESASKRPRAQLDGALGEGTYCAQFDSGLGS